MTREELTIQIEKYLDGVLPESEAKNLELLIVADDAIAREFEFHKTLREGLATHYMRQELKQKMAQWENDKSFPVQNKRKNSLWRPIMAAASISLLVTVGGVSIYHFAYRNNIDGKIKDELQVLAKEVEKTSLETEHIKIESNKKFDEVVAGQPVLAATAFALTTDGYLMTNYHVVKDKKYVTIEQQVGDSLVTYNAEVMETDKKLDFALLRIKDDKFTALPKIPYAISDKDISLAEKIFTLGYPKSDVVYSEGAISSMSGYKGDTMFYQLNIIAAPGASGSPIMNEKGELLGILSSRNAMAVGETYCVKMKYILDRIGQLKAKNNKLDIKTSAARSKLTGKRLTDQVKAMMPFVFIVKA